jgi:hypothetical protein
MLILRVCYNAVPLVTHFCVRNCSDSRRRCRRLLRRRRRRRLYLHQARSRKSRLITGAHGR